MAELIGFALLLFATRFLARAHLVPLTDQECHIGGIAVDVLAHGIRFPLLAYAPNEYDNGSFFSGLLTAASFATLGRNVLALKLVTHLIAAAGAVAALALLRRGLDELHVVARGARWTAVGVLVIGVALAPRIVTLSSLYAVGNHAEGAAIGMLLLAVFAVRARRRSVPLTALLWALVAIAIYLNKGAVLVVPALGLVEVALSWRRPARLLGAAAGAVLGSVPELLVIAQRHALGWSAIGEKVERHAHGFPRAFVESVWALVDARPALLLASVLALVWAAARVADSLRRGQWGDASDAAPPVAVTLVVGYAVAHLVALAFMAQGAFDAYAIYGYAPLVVLIALAVGVLRTHVAARTRAAAASSAAALLLALVLLRPDAISAGPPSVGELWRDRDGAACAWRFGEGFGREQSHGLGAIGEGREEHAIARCRSLTDRDLALDCIGGIARELHWRGRGRVAGAPPAPLDADERRAYAYLYGTHRFGAVAACGDFADPALVAECRAAVGLECLAYADVASRFATGIGVGRPRCDIPPPPMRGYWSAQRAALLARPADGPPPALAGATPDLTPCAPVFADCL